MQQEITTRHALLDSQGHLTEAGYTKGLLMDYDRRAIKAGSLRIKEWDYYLITCRDYAVALTIADNSYMSLDSISLLDFRTGWQQTTSPMGVLTLGKRNLPVSSSNGDLCVSKKNYGLEFLHRGDHRLLRFHMKNFCDGKPLSGEIRLENPPQESMVICTPFAEKKTAFYYNQKINCLPASGHVEFDGSVYEFRPGEAFGVLDWGRGVWTYKNTWYWSSASGLVDGEPFGFNLGYGFGDGSAATENALIYGGKVHKLSHVKFHIPGKPGREDWLSPWTFTSDDGRLEMEFRPILDRAACADVKVLKSDQHQVFGRFTGRAVLDHGETLQFRDLTGFAEKVVNKW